MKMINTLNESSLHKSLKQLYSLDEGSTTESEINGKIYDIVDKNGNIIEIQTQNLSKLLKKAGIILESGKKFKIVHPIPVEKMIELYDFAGNLISKRKSPKKGSVYSVFRELTGIHHILLNENFTLEILLIKMTEMRIRTEKAVQTENKRRRFKRNWLKRDKKLDSIIETITFSQKEHYIKLLPEDILPEFSASDLKKALLKRSKFPSSAADNAGIMLWVLSHAGLIKSSDKKARNRLYKIKR